MLVHSRIKQMYTSALTYMCFHLPEEKEECSEGRHAPQSEYTGLEY